MKFQAIINEAKHVESFSRTILIISRICKKLCVIRITADEFTFFNSYDVREGISMSLRLNQSQIFSHFIFQGLNAENNTIFLEVSMSDLLLSTACKDGQIVLKLSQRDKIPLLIVENRADCTIKHEIPAAFVPLNSWNDYNDAGKEKGALVSLQLPETKIMHRILSAIKNMSTKTVTLRANNNGELCIKSETDLVKIEVFMRNLENHVLLEGRSQELPAQNQFFSVMVDLKILHEFFGNSLAYFNYVCLEIIHGRSAVLTSKMNFCIFRLSMAGFNAHE